MMHTVHIGVAAGLARDRRSLMLDKGSKLHGRLKQEGRLLQDHRYRIRVYPKSFCGCDFVKWLIEIGEAGDASEAVRLGQGLLESAVIHHGQSVYLALPCVTPLLQYLTSTSSKTAH